jgi:hypothetical protein
MAYPAVVVHVYCPSEPANGQHFPAPQRDIRRLPPSAAHATIMTSPTKGLFTWRKTPVDSPLQVGQMAPDFKLMNQDKNEVRLSDYRGKKKVMLLFYPWIFPDLYAGTLSLRPAFDKFERPGCGHCGLRRQYRQPIRPRRL